MKIQTLVEMAKQHNSDQVHFSETEISENELATLLIFMCGSTVMGTHKVMPCKDEKLKEDVFNQLKSIGEIKNVYL